VRLSEADRRTIAGWSAECALRTLALFEAAAPGDDRPRAAIDGARAFSRGEARERAVVGLAVRAHAAAREVRDAAAISAARSAGTAAAVAAMHAPETLGTARHALGAAMYAALARELSAGGNPLAADAEVRWALGHASAAVRAAYASIAPPRASGSRLGSLEARLDAGLRQT
jgi:immunity protein 5 of polymorphic toxin system